MKRPCLHSCSTSRIGYYRRY
ncbi:hypothetical protein Godav_023335 [Gossypium davidsonii]|uniref:Uncharacterized protein n=1 Tax=Gossypium davidsonii TaxID=34287 RepID=A0A7J8SRU3_GOSDV|nr:hypothetical protein [Gossypium davidsonii]